MNTLYELLALLILFLGGEGVVRLCELFEMRHPGADLWESLFITLYLVLFGVFLFLTTKRGSHKSDE